MAYIVTLNDFAPPARADATPFTKARIEEAPLKTGAWTVIDTLNLAAETHGDPEHPEPRDLTTKLATLTEGWYRVTWIDGAGGLSVPTAPVQNENDLAGGVRPTIADVASLLRARTKIRGGVETGTFTAATRPTADEVDDLIDEAVDEVQGKIEPLENVQNEVGEPEAAGYERRIRGAIRLYAAILVETSYWPEQVKTGQSAAEMYQKLYESRIEALIAEGKTGKPEGDGGGQSPGNPYWTFPTDTGGLVGWASRW